MRWLIVFLLAACEERPPIIFAPEHDFSVIDMATAELDPDLSGIDFSNSDLLEPSSSPSPGTDGGGDMAQFRDMATSVQRDMAQPADFAPLCEPLGADCYADTFHGDFVGNCCEPGNPMIYCGLSGLTGKQQCCASTPGYTGCAVNNDCCQHSSDVTYCKGTTGLCCYKDSSQIEHCS